MPVEVERPEGDDGKHLDLSKLDRRAAQDVVYHNRGLLLPPLASLLVFVPPWCCPYSAVACRRHECRLAPIPHTRNIA